MVVLEVGQLVGTLIESHRQFSAGIVIPEKNISNSCATLLSAIPSLYDGISMIGFGSQGNGAARAVNIYYLLAGLLTSSIFVN